MKLVEVEVADQYIVVALEGSLDIAGVQAVEMDFAEKAAIGKHMIVNMSQVDFLASMGIRMLLGAAKKLALSHKKLILAAPGQMVNATLCGAGVDTILPMMETVEEAGFSLTVE